MSGPRSTVELVAAAYDTFSCDGNELLPLDGRRQLAAGRVAARFTRTNDVTIPAMAL
jgi:hypothetical protein